MATSGRCSCGSLRNKRGSQDLQMQVSDPLTVWGRISVIGSEMQRTSYRVTPGRRCSQMKLMRSWHPATLQLFHHRSLCDWEQGMHIHARDMPALRRQFSSREGIAEPGNHWMVMDSRRNLEWILCPRAGGSKLRLNEPVASVSWIPLDAP